MARLAFTTVSSRRTTISPALTVSPSCARTSPTTPPVGCCTFLTLESTTTCPGAISAPEIGTVEAQPPKPQVKTSITTRPTTMCERIDSRAPFRSSFGFQIMTFSSSRLGSGIGNDLDRRRRRDALQYLAEHGFLGSEGLHAAVLQHQQLIDRLDADRPVRHHDHDGAALAGAAHRAGQRFVALGIEVGVRLIEHDQERIAVQRPRQRHALRLSCRKRR